MSNKVAILSDIHFGKRSVDFLNLQLEFFEKQFFPYIIENKIENVIQLGDIFDSRKYSLNQMLSEVGKRFFHKFTELKINLYVIVGNHDTPDRESAKHSPLYQYKNKYIHIVGDSKLINIDDVDISLHSYFNTKIVKANIGFFHTEFNGLLMDKRTIVEDRTNLPSNDFDKIYSGHFHSSPEKIYLNTPMPLSFESFGCKNGFFILDTYKFKQDQKNYDLEFIENNVSPKFIKVYYKSKNEIKVDYGNNNIDVVNNIDILKDKISNDIIELHIENVDDKLVIDDLVTNIGKRLEYTFQDYLVGDVVATDEKMETFTKDDLVNMKDLLNEYLVINEKEIPDSIDIKQLKKDFIEIYDEILTEI